jgi:hypothetical protein
MKNVGSLCLYSYYDNTQCGQVNSHSSDQGVREISLFRPSDAWSSTLQTKGHVNFYSAGLVTWSFTLQAKKHAKFHSSVQEMREVPLFRPSGTWSATLQIKGHVKFHSSDQGAIEVSPWDEGATKVLLWDQGVREVLPWDHGVREILLWDEAVRAVSLRESDAWSFTLRARGWGWELRRLRRLRDAAVEKSVAPSRIKS